MSRYEVREKFYGIGAEGHRWLVIDHKGNVGGTCLILKSYKSLLWAVKTAARLNREAKEMGK